MITKKILFLTYIFLIALFFMASLSHAVPVGKISSLEGRVDVLKPGSNTATPVKLNDSVDVGDIYRAKSNSKAEITFVNKNLVRIASNTRLEIQQYMVEGDTSTGVMKLHRGRVQAVAADELVKKVGAFAEGKNKFEIHTQNAVAGIRGTNMIVFIERGLTGVLFLAGRGYLFNPRAAVRVIQNITAGNISFVVAPTANPTPPRRATQSEITTQINSITPTQPSQAPPGGQPPAGGPPAGQQQPQFIQGAAIVVAGPPAPGIGPVQQFVAPPPPPPPPVTQQDTTPPIVDITSKPPMNTNSATANFAFKANEQSTFQYRLDSGKQWINAGKGLQSTLNLTGLSNGDHTIYVRGLDAVGNASVISTYQWTIDTTPPTIGFTDKPNSTTESHDATFGFSSNKKATYQYKLDNGTEWIDVTDSTLDLKGLSDGQHTIYVRSLDNFGNYSDPASYQWTIESYRYASDIGINNLSGTLSISGNLWKATKDNPTPIKMEGTIVKRIGGLDIHAADQGWQGGSWTALLPGGVTHANSYSQDNRITSSNHPIVQGLDNSHYQSWGYTSHGYFTNLYPNTVVILNDSGNKDKPTTIEYLYQKDQNSNKVFVIASMQTLEWAYYNNYADNGLPLRNTIAYLLHKSGITPNRGKLLLLQDTKPWGYDSNKLLLDSWGISYDIKKSADFSTLDLSLYSAIIISSDQSSTFYSNIASNISKFDSFSAPGFVDTWFTDIYSYNKSNSTYTTNDGGAYRGLIGGAQINDTMNGKIVALGINPTGAGGLIKGHYSGSYNLTNSTWTTTGAMFPVYLENNMNIKPEDLYANITQATFYKYASPSGTTSLGTGYFDAGGTITTNFIYGMTQYITGYDKWGVYASEMGGVFSGTASDKWTSIVDYYHEGMKYGGINIKGEKWSDNKISGDFTGYHVGSNRSSVIAGDVFGTFNPNDYKWHAINIGVWLEVNKFLELAATEEGRQKLQQLNIPSFQVGVVTLEQISTNSALNNVRMTDVKFFSPSSGGIPSIWATGSVTGGFAGTPTNVAANLSGGGLSATFTMKQWDTTNNRWVATVTDGKGSIAGGGVNVKNLDFRGAAGGTFTGSSSGTFSGTGAGVVKQSSK